MAVHITVPSSVRTFLNRETSVISNLSAVGQTVPHSLSSRVVCLSSFHVWHTFSTLSNSHVWPTFCTSSNSRLQPANSMRSLALRRQRGKPFHANSLKCCIAVASAPVDGTVESSLKGSAAGKVVVIDNYDSFTYNLCQYLGDLGCDFIVYRNDEITVDQLRDMRPKGILISPGPGTPEDSGISMETVRELGPTVPLFGVCMGLQCMGQVYGGRIVRAPGGVMHGKTSDVYHKQTGADGGLLVGLPNPFTAARYHSLVIDRETFPGGELEVTAWTADGLVMGVRHVTYRHVEGVQFHPESIITENGIRIVANFLHGLELREKALQQQF